MKGEGASSEGLTLYQNPKSGEARAVWALLKLLGPSFQVVPVERAADDPCMTSHLLRATADDIPILRDDRLIFCKSAVALVHLARRFDPSGTWLPQNCEQASQVKSWLTIVTRELSRDRHKNSASEVTKQPMTVLCGQSALQTRFEPHLGHGSWLVGTDPTIADVACYGHISLRPERGESLEEFPNVVAWLNRVERLISAAKLVGKLQRHSGLS